MHENQAHPLWGKVRKIKLSEVRQAIPGECYKRSTSKVMFWFAVDAAIFLFGMFIIFSSSNVVLKLIGSSISSIATGMMFVWSHDASHGTLFKNPRIAELLGTLMMLPSLNIFRMWTYGHNKVHHGFTSFSPIDWVWRPLTVKQYQELSTCQRILYRVERNFFTCGFHYLRRIWWEGMILYNPGKKPNKQRYYRNGKLIVLAYAVVAASLAYFFAGGIIGIFAVVVLPFIVFNYFIAIAVYLHHTHPDIPFTDIKKEWTHSTGAMYCSTVFYCTKISSMITHNIMIHIPHHLDTRIPFYHLPRAYQALKKDYSEFFHEYQFKWSDVRNIFKQCKLYDFENNIWMTFAQAK